MRTLVTAETESQDWEMAPMNGKALRNTEIICR